MNFKWTENLVAECRNRDIVPYGKMSVFARRAILLLRRGGNTEFYSEAGWLPVALEIGRLCGPLTTTAYRIQPSFNPMKKKGRKS